MEQLKRKDQDESNKLGWAGIGYAREFRLPSDPVRLEDKSWLACLIGILRLAKQNMTKIESAVPCCAAREISTRIL